MRNNCCVPGAQSSRKILSMRADVHGVGRDAARGAFVTAQAMVAGHPRGLIDREILTCGKGAHAEKYLSIGLPSPVRSAAPRNAKPTIESLEQGNLMWSWIIREEKNPEQFQLLP